MFKVFYKYSACINIVTKDIKLLCDPWFGNGAFEGTWTQFPKNYKFPDSIGEFDAVYISHIHPDHYCSDSLKTLFKKYGKKKYISLIGLGCLTI